MVTKVRTQEQVDVQSLNIHQAAAMIGMPIAVRPWWGSRRTRATRYHIKCGESLSLLRDNFCTKCQVHVSPQDTGLRWDHPRRWLCPGNGRTYYYSIKWPEVQKGVVVLWEGPCHDHWGYRRHAHSQDLEVLDVGETAFLLKVKVSCHINHFLIGMDDGHPFVTPVPKTLTTVQDAFDWFVPTLVREAMVLGKDVKRQGDWFFIPTDRVPKLFNVGNRNVVGSEQPGLKCNKLYRGAALAYWRQTRHRGGLVIYGPLARTPLGTAPYVKGNVKAPDHPTLHLKTWHIGIRRRTAGHVNPTTERAVDD